MRARVAGRRLFANRRLFGGSPPGGAFSAASHQEAPFRLPTKRRLFGGFPPRGAFRPPATAPQWASAPQRRPARVRACAGLGAGLGARAPWCARDAFVCVRRAHIPTTTMRTTHTRARTHTHTHAHARMHARTHAHGRRSVRGRGRRTGEVGGGAAHEAPAAQRRQLPHYCAPNRQRILAPRAMKEDTEDTDRRYG